MSLPWWGWVSVAVVGVVVLLALLVRGFRRRVRSEFVRFLAAERPEWRVEVVGGGAIEIRRGSDDEVGTLHPHKLYDLVAEMNAHDETARRPAYEKFLRVIEEGSAGALDPESDRGRLLPRIVTTEQLEEMRRALGEVPAAPLGVEGLAVVLVLDATESVRYLGAVSLAETKPSTTISASAGTWSGTVRQRASLGRSPRRMPEKLSSDMPSGSGSTAESIVAGSAPMTTATGVSWPAEAQSR